MKALLITYHFPPMLGCCSLRTGAVARTLAAKGWECHILTAAIPTDHPVYTVDAQTQTSEPLWHLYPISEGRMGRVIQRLRQGRFRSRPARPVSTEHDALPRPSWRTNLLKAMAFPDSKANWIPGALGRVKRLVKLQQFDLIYSFGYPWSCHVIACAAQQRCGAPWVADYADPWTHNPDTEAFPSWRKSLDFWLESRLLRRTAAVVVATPEAQLLLSRLFGPELAKRTQVARVAQFPSDEYASPTGPLPEHFQLAFTGLFDPTRQPEYFFDAAKIFTGQCDVRILLAGLIDERYLDYARRRGVDPLIRHVGRLDRRQTIALQQTSHVLVSFGWPGGLQVPCKIYEYFAARRPILHIAGDAQDPAAILVRKYRRGLVVHNDRRAIGEGLRRLCELWKEGKLEEHFDLSRIDEFCLPRSLEGLQQAFEGVLPREGQRGAVSVSNSVAAQAPSAT
jgi:glycosyltransferase involved in cell wall biosynthesis